MRRLYAERREGLAAALTDHYGAAIDLAPSEAGMHLLAHLSPDLAPGLSDRDIQARAAEEGVTVSALSAYYAAPTDARGLLLGFSAVPVETMPAAARSAKFARFFAGWMGAYPPGVFVSSVKLCLAHSF